MTVTEFSNEFDILYNNNASNEAPGVDEYEKSVFLTKAQDEVIKDYFGGNNVYKQGFDQSIKRQHDFSTLMRRRVLEEADGDAFDARAYMFKAPEDLFLPVNEYVLDSTEVSYQVVPITYSMYTQLMVKPYGLPIKRCAWRLTTGSDDGPNTVFEVIGRFTPPITYHMRYVKRPDPIILVDLEGISEGLSINGVSQVTECMLPPSLHVEILQRAVELAKLTYTSVNDAAGQTTIGQRSE